MRSTRTTSALTVAWALLNSGTRESDYGYWYPGKENDGGAGCGFEPAPHGTTWLEQPHHRGSCYYSCEIDLGFSGALRTAATVLTDDPIFGRFCLGGDWKHAGKATEVIPRDGVRRRFHAMLAAGRLHMELGRDRFSSATPIVLADDLSSVAFALETDTPESHTATLRLSGLTAGTYHLRGARSELLATVAIEDGRERLLELPVSAGAASTFAIPRA